MNNKVTIEIGSNADKIKLIKEIEKRILTSFIFSLAQMEEQLGFLWGEELENDSQMSEEQKRFDLIYEGIRKRVLDNGHKQLRHLLDEINYYNITRIKGYE